MRKVLSLALVACIVFSCLALSACAWEGIFGTTTSTVPTVSTTQPTTTSTTATTTTTTVISDGGEPEDLVINHGDNFTEDDIEFVKSLQGKYIGPSGNHTLYSFDKMVEAGKFDVPIYLISIDLEHPYYICAYVKSNDLSYPFLDISQCTWYKFYDINSIPDSINDEQLLEKYLLYDCTIRKDIVNNIEYEYHCIYYCSRKTVLLGESYSNILVYYPNEKIIKDNELTVLEHKRNEHSSFSVYIENACDYIYFTYEIITIVDGISISEEGDAKQILGEYYDVLSPHFERLEGLDIVGVDYLERPYQIRYIGINVEVLSQILFGENNDYE